MATNRACDLPIYQFCSISTAVNVHKHGLHQTSRLHFHMVHQLGDCKWIGYIHHPKLASQFDDRLLLAYPGQYLPEASDLPRHDKLADRQNLFLTFQTTYRQPQAVRD